jgi:hypothetical protein
MSGWVSCWLPEGGGAALLDLQLFPATVLQGLPLFKYYIFCQMRHDLYERLGELLATRGGSALLDLQLLPATVLQGLPLFMYSIFLSDETRPVRAAG